MAIYLGNNKITPIYLGGVEIGTVYLGNNKVYEKNTAINLMTDGVLNTKYVESTTWAGDYSSTVQYGKTYNGKKCIYLPNFQKSTSQPTLYCKIKNIPQGIYIVEVEAYYTKSTSNRITYGNDYVNYNATLNVWTNVMGYFGGALLPQDFYIKGIKGSYSAVPEAYISSIKLYKATLTSVFSGSSSYSVTSGNDRQIFEKTISKNKYKGFQATIQVNGGTASSEMAAGRITIGSKIIDTGSVTSPTGSSTVTNVAVGMFNQEELALINAGGSIKFLMHYAGGSATTADGIVSEIGFLT